MKTENFSLVGSTLYAYSINNWTIKYKLDVHFSTYEWCCCVNNIIKILNHYLQDKSICTLIPHLPVCALLSHIGVVFAQLSLCLCAHWNFWSLIRRWGHTRCICLRVSDKQSGGRLITSDCPFQVCLPDFLWGQSLTFKLVCCGIMSDDLQWP